jgi:hypothetical protein
MRTMMQRTKDETKVNVRVEEPLKIAQSVFLEYYGITAGRSEGDMAFDGVKEQIKLASADIAISKSEKERYFKLSTSTLLIMAAISKMVNDKREANENNPLVKKYDELEGILDACNLITIGFDTSESAYSYKLSTFVSKKEDDHKEHESIESGAMEVKYDGLQHAISLAEENGYRRLNCSASSNFFKALSLAFKIGFLTNEDVTMVKAKIVRPEEFKE